MIPKRIWQTWKTHTVPEQWKASPESIHKYCPDWTYQLMDDQDNLQFVQETFPEYLSLYLQFDREIYRADMVRYLLLYKYGGVYLDLDIQLQRPLDHLFNTGSDLYLVQTPNWVGYTNSFMASAPNCPFWMKCIQKIKDRVENKPWYIQGDLKVLWTTGPNMVSEVIREYNHPYVTVPYKLGHPCTICDHYLGRNCVNVESYIQELPGSSWSTSASLFHFLICRWQLVVFILIVLILVLVLGTVRFGSTSLNSTTRLRQSNLIQPEYMRMNPRS